MRSDKDMSLIRKEQIDERHAKIARFATLEDPGAPSVRTTILDWRRNISGKSGTVYFNGQLAFTPDEATEMLTETQLDESDIHDETIRFAKAQEVLDQKFDAYFKGINPKIKDYILRYANQAGFLQISEDVTRSLLTTQHPPKQFTNTTRSDFIQNADGSVTYIEVFYIDKSIIMGQKEIKQITSKDGRPLAMGVMATKIYLDQQNEVKLGLLEDKIIITSPEGAELIQRERDEFKGMTIETLCQEPIEQIQEELNQHMRTLGYISRREQVGASVVGNLNEVDKQFVVASEEENHNLKEEEPSAKISAQKLQRSPKPETLGSNNSKTSFVASAKEFVKQHWGKILLGGLITGVVAGAIVAGLFSFGIGTVAVGAIGGGVVAGLGLLGLKVGAGIGIGLGAAAVAKASIVAGASAGVAVGTAIEGYQNRHRHSQAGIRKKLAAAKPSSRSTQSQKISMEPEAKGFAGFIRSFFTHNDAKKSEDSTKKTEAKVKPTEPQTGRKNSR
jgi:hypothetical protein